MPRRKTDIFEIIVLATGAQTFLHRCGARVGSALLAGEDFFELVHTGVDKHQSRIIKRNHRRRGHDFVVMPGEIVEKRLSDIGCQSRFAGDSRWFGLAGFLPCLAHCFIVVSYVQIK